MATKYKVILDRGVDVVRKGVAAVAGEEKHDVTVHYAHGETVIDPPAEDAANMVRWGHLEPLADAPAKKEK